MHSERLRSRQGEDSPLVNLLPVGAANVGPDAWILPLWAGPLVPQDTVPAWVRCALSMFRWASELVIGVPHAPLPCNRGSSRRALVAAVEHLCARTLFRGDNSKCFYSTMATAEDIRRWPVHIRRRHGSLANSWRGEASTMGK